MFFDIELGNEPLIAVAIHNGHEVRDEVARRMALDEAARLREEDPQTGLWTCIAKTRIVVLRSRFEVDLNRPRDKAVYMTPDQAWGLKVWREPPSPEIVARSLEEYDSFYRELHRICSWMEKKHQRFTVLDLHSYNHRRDGPSGPLADSGGNPDINVGTGTMNRDRWGNLVDRFIHDLQSFEYCGRRLDVRENVKFYGGQLPRYIHENFPASGCALPVEVKKFFMDEWTGELDRTHHEAIGRALASTVPGIVEEMKAMG